MAAKRIPGVPVILKSGGGGGGGSGTGDVNASGGALTSGKIILGAGTTDISASRVTLTNPATTATITVADNKVLTVSNTVTLSGTDSSTVAFGAGGTVLYAGDVDTVAERAALGFLSTTGGGVATRQAHSTTGAAETFDLANGNWHTATLDANCTFTLSGFTSGKGCTMFLGLTQDGTGGWVVTWPGAVVSVPPVDLTLGATTWIALWSEDGGTTIYASSTYAPTFAVYGVGTAYSLTNTAAAIDFGTTDPTKVLTTAGRYLIQAQVHLAYTGATVVAETATIKVRRTNNTAADLSDVIVLDLPVATTLTHTYGIFPIPPFIYTTTATDDSISIFANVSAALGAGTINATALGTSLVAIKI